MSVDYSIHYKRFHDESEAHALSMAEWLGNYLREDLPEDRSAPVLDVGCGFGFALRALRAAGFRNVHGVEISPHQAGVARRGGFDVSLVADTVGYLRGNPSRFGAILLLDVLEHIPVSGQIEMVRSIREALLPGGRVILTVPNANSPLAARWRYIDFTHHCSFTEHSLHFVLSSAGFENVHMDNEKGIGAFPKCWWQRKHRDALRKWIVRFVWLQVFKAELHASERLDDICLELNLKAKAFNAPQRLVTSNTSSSL